MMNVLYLLLLAVCFPVYQSLESCPAGCFCDKKKGEHLPIQDGLRIHCVPMEDHNFNFLNLPNTTLQLELTNYDLKTIDKTYFSHIKYIEKLDLRRNSIHAIEDDAFQNLAYLKILDLSDNNIAKVNANTFRGLTKLEKLKLTSNKITGLQYGAFSSLKSIKKIDLSDNPLKCDCHLAWLLEWIDVAGSKARCGSPIFHQDNPIRKLDNSDLTCDIPTHGNRINNFYITPHLPQLSFVGDALRLKCRVGRINKELLLRWYLNDRRLTPNEASITNLTPRKDQTSIGYQSSIYVSSLTMDHSGNWTCSAFLDTGEVENRTVSVLIISPTTVLCPSTTTNTSKGFYRWSVAVSGQTVSNTCVKSPGKKQNEVTYTCDSRGQWGELNTSRCAHTNDVTDKLYRFAMMNNTIFDQVSLLQSARKLLEFTSHTKIFVDGMDLVYLSRCVENYLPFLTTNPELAGLIVNIASNAMLMNPKLVKKSQLYGKAATRLMATITNITMIVPAFQHHTSSLAIEGFKVAPRSFSGITCTWYSPSTLDDDPNLASKVFYCSENNKTLGGQGRVILGSVQLPSTLYYQLGLLNKDINTAKNLMFSAFSNDTLFPQVSSTKSTVNVNHNVASCVIGGSVLSVEPFNLSEPVYVVLRRFPDFGSKEQVLPAWWDPRANSGLGAWQPEYCKLMKARFDSVVFSCQRLGHYALLSKADFQSRMQTDDVFGMVLKPSHPAVYGGTVVAIICLGTAVFVYAVGFSNINMSAKLKHALPNTWLSILFLLVFFALGGELISDMLVCEAVGLLLHYFSLTSLIWLGISASIIYKKITKPLRVPVRRSNPYILTPEEEVHVGTEPGKKLKKPMARFYLVGWGVPMIICGITGGANIAQYMSAEWCFLQTAPALGALLVPAVIIFLILFGFLIATLCVSPNEKVESRVDASYLTTYNSRLSLASVSSLHVPDTEKSPRSHVTALFGVTVLLCGVWLSAVLVTTKPLQGITKDLQEMIFGILYAVFASALGIAVMIYYCLLRQDLLNCCHFSDRCISPQETSNLVDLQGLAASKLNTTKTTTLKTNNMSQQGYNGSILNVAKSDTEYSTFRNRPIAMNELGGSVMGPSVRLKQCNVTKADSEVSSDYLSVNNAAHLRRPGRLPNSNVVGYIPPANSAGGSEAESARSVTDFLFGPSAKDAVNNVNIHVEANSTPWREGDVGGKIGWNGQGGHLLSKHRSGSSVPLDSYQSMDMTVDSSHLPINKTDISYIGDTTVDFLEEFYPPPGLPMGGPPGQQIAVQMPHLYQPSPRARDPIPMSASLPRRISRDSKSRERKNRRDDRMAMSGYSDAERLEVCSNSKYSEVSTSTAYSVRSGRSSNRKKRSKPRRKLRKRSQVLPDARKTITYDPIYEAGAKMDDEYFGDEDHVEQQKALMLNEQSQDLQEGQTVLESKAVPEVFNPLEKNLSSNQTQEQNLSSNHSSLNNIPSSHFSNTELHNKETCV